MKIVLTSTQQRIKLRNGKIANDYLQARQQGHARGVVIRSLTKSYGLSDARLRQILTSEHVYDY